MKLVPVSMACCAIVTLTVGCGSTMRNVTTVSSVETSPSHHYVELLGDKGFTNEKNFPGKLAAYANNLCTSGYTVSQSQLNVRYTGTLPITSCSVNACAGDEMLRAKIQCNSSGSAPIFSSQGSQWFYPSQDRVAFQRLKNTEAALEARLDRAQEPDKILLAKDLMVWVYANHYIVMKTVRRPLGTAPVELQVRMGQPDIR